MKYHPEEKNVKCYKNENFYKNKKMFQIYLNSDLKNEPDLKSRYFFTLLWTNLNPNVGKYPLKYVTSWIYLKISET